MTSIPLPSAEEIRTIYRKGEDTVVASFVQMVTVVRSLEARIQALEDQLATNSSSSKPPSSGGYREGKRRGLHQASGKKVDAQEGHPGHALKAVEQPPCIELVINRMQGIQLTHSRRSQKAPANRPKWHPITRERAAPYVRDLTQLDDFKTNTVLCGITCRLITGVTLIDEGDLDRFAGCIFDFLGQFSDLCPSCSLAGVTMATSNWLRVSTANCTFDPFRRL